LLQTEQESEQQSTRSVQPGSQKQPPGAGVSVALQMSGSGAATQPHSTGHVMSVSPKPTSQTPLPHPQSAGGRFAQPKSQEINATVH